jgi:hypothetical protein
MKLWTAFSLLGTVDVWAAPVVSYRALAKWDTTFPRGVTLKMSGSPKPISGRQLKIAASKKFLARLNIERLM